jgi:hypothetical protein
VPLVIQLTDDEKTLWRCATKHNTLSQFWVKGPLVHIQSPRRSVLLVQSIVPLVIQLTDDEKTVWRCATR